MKINYGKRQHNEADKQEQACGAESNKNNSYNMCKMIIQMVNFCVSEKKISWKYSAEAPHSFTNTKLYTVKICLHLLFSLSSMAWFCEMCSPYLNRTCSSYSTVHIPSSFILTLIFWVHFKVGLSSFLCLFIVFNLFSCPFMFFASWFLFNQNFISRAKEMS